MFKFFQVIFVFAFLAGLGYWYWTTTPEYSLKQVRDALRQHDTQKFEKYVDTDSVASGLVDDLLTKPMQEMLGPGVLGHWLLAGIVGFVKPELTTGVKQEINNFVASGELSNADANNNDQDAISNLNPRLSLFRIDRKLGFRKHAFRKVEYDRKSDKIATVGMLLHNQVYDQDLLLEVKMRDSGGYWRIFELSNFPDFSSKIIELEAQRAREASPSDQSSKAGQGI